MPAAESYLLDTSAILALTDREHGFEAVAALLDRAAVGGAEVLICGVSLMELYYVALQEQGEDEAALLVALVKAWPVRWIYPDEQTLLVAGRIKAANRLSFADAVIAGTAKLEGARLVHKDPEFEPLSDELSLHPLPYKKRH